MIKTILKKLIFIAPVSIVLGAIVLILFVPYSGGHPTRRFQLEMKSMMGQLLLLEDAHLADSGFYSADPNALGLVVPESVDLQIELLRADNSRYMGYRAFAESKEIDYNCRALIGVRGDSVALTPDSLVEVLDSGYECESGDGS